MIPAITREEMIEVDRLMVQDLNISVPLMMEHAGVNLARLVHSSLDNSKIEEILVIAGSGNNGGGGLVCARRLANWGKNVSVWLPKGEAKNKIPQQQYNRAIKCGVKLVEQLENEDFNLIIDALIGYNFRGQLDQLAQTVIDLMKKNNVISLDIPSGIDSTTGQNYANIEPIATLTLAWIKSGIINQKKSNIGELYLADIGVPSWVYLRDAIFTNPTKPSSDQINRIYTKFAKNSFIPVTFSKDGWEIE
ncbi:MAG: NAD(P)H-hydrate epimerase [Candidatus Kariarchaeaceae archaeon]|jgi:NAD(P)H-hydrate epimerase